MSIDTPPPLDLSLAEAKNQRTTKSTRMSGFKVTCCVEAIKKRMLEMYGRGTFYFGTTNHTHIGTL